MRRAPGSVTDLKQSALSHLHEQLGATFMEHQGWRVPESFSSPESEAAGVREMAGLSDLSYRAKYDTRTLPLDRWWRLGADHYLVTGEPPLPEPLDATDITSVYANLLLVGPQSRDILSKLSSLNVSDEALPNLTCSQTNVAHAHAIVLREDLGAIPAYHLLVSREYAESVWESVARAGAEFRIVSFGLKALELLRS